MKLKSIEIQNYKSIDVRVAELQCYYGNLGDSVELNLSDLTNGVYLLRIQSGGVSTQDRIVVQR